MNEKYILSDDVKYRREKFGGIIFDKKSKETLFFNHLAALSLENFRTPATLKEMKRSLSMLTGCGDVEDEFFESIVDSSIIVEANGKPENARHLYFSDVTDFQENCLYSPLAVELELTLKCMRNCAYCAYNSSPYVSTEGQLDFRDYLKILDKLERAGVFYIRFTGGDPLTRSDSIEIMNEANNLEFGFAVASDLTALSKMQARKLGEFENLISLQTTLDGSTQSIADKLRGQGSFRRTIRGIDLLRAHGVPLIVGTILTKYNVDDIYNIAKVLSEYNVSYCVSPLYDAGRAKNLNALIPSNDDLARAYDQFALAVEDGLVLPADPGWCALAQHLDKKERDSLWSNQPWLVRSPDQILRVDPLGRCYTSIHLKEVVSDDIYVGKLQSNDVIELWNRSPLLNSLRENATTNKYYGEVLDIRDIKKILEQNNEH